MQIIDKNSPTIVINHTLKLIRPPNYQKTKQYQKWGIAPPPS